jgi:hypothetical protein
MASKLRSSTKAVVVYFKVSPADSEKHQKKSQPGEPENRPRFELGTFQIQVGIVTSTPTCTMALFKPLSNNHQGPNGFECFDY